MDLRLSISTSRHGKSVWFEQRYCLSKQTNGIKAIGNGFQRKLSNNRLRHLRPSFTRLQVYRSLSYNNLDTSNIKNNVTIF
jgi:hypothetical protein